MYIMYKPYDLMYFHFIIYTAELLYVNIYLFFFRNSYDKLEEEEEKMVVEREVWHVNRGGVLMVLTPR